MTKKGFDSNLILKFDNDLNFWIKYQYDPKKIKFISKIDLILSDPEQWNEAIISTGYLFLKTFFRIAQKSFFTTTLNWHRKFFKNY